MAKVKTTIVSWTPHEVMENARKAAEAKLMEAAQQVAAEAQRLAPVRTGRLKNSIRVLGIERGARKIRITIGSDVPYAAHVELGVPKTQPPQPFLRPAIYVDLPEKLGRIMSE